MGSKTVYRVVGNSQSVQNVSSIYETRELADEFIITQSRLIVDAMKKGLIIKPEFLPKWEIIDEEFIFE